MTMTERYWIHSDPEPPEVTSADLSASTVYTAHAPRECLNGCESQQGDARSKVFCEPGQLLCPRCTTRLDAWLRAIPDAYTLLPSVVDHGTVPSDPGTKHTKRPDPPAPMRLEVADLLDTREGRGALGIVHSWATVVREERNLPVPRCHCDHARPTHAGRCSAIGCDCRGYIPGPFYVYAECSLLLAHLAWCTQQDWAGDLYDEVRRLNRDLALTVGDYRVKPVGKCAALQDRPGVPLPVLCGGALVMEQEGSAVKCLSCGTRHEANEGLRELGLIVGAMFGETMNQEAS